MSKSSKKDNEFAQDARGGGVVTLHSKSSCSSLPKYLNEPFLQDPSTTL
jgi:hypothetical protein